MNDNITEMENYSSEINNGLDECMTSTEMESQPLRIENKTEEWPVKNS